MYWVWFACNLEISSLLTLVFFTVLSSTEKKNRVNLNLNAGKIINTVIRFNNELISEAKWDYQGILYGLKTYN